MSDSFENNFKKRTSILEVEESLSLCPKFDNNGLMPCITTDHLSGEVLMVGYMNAESLTLSIERGEAYYFSRSQNKIWHKGSVSGLTQKIIEMKIDDDQDSIWISVEVAGEGASCHVGYKSCFYRSVPLGKIENTEKVEMKFEEKEKKFDPEKVYEGQSNPTKL